MNLSAVDDRVLKDLEDLAAYLDGLLPEDRRAAIESRLAEDSDFYEIFLDTVRFREEEGAEVLAETQATEVQDAAQREPESIQRIGPEEAVYDVVAASRLPFRYVAASLAAAAALMLVVWKPWKAFQSLKTQDKAFYAQTNADALKQLETHVRGWSVFRSGDPQAVPEGREQEVAFRLGAYQVHLELAVKSKDPTAGLEALRSINRELIRLPGLHFQETAELQALEVEMKKGDVAWDQVSSRSEDFQESLGSAVSNESSQRDAERWGRWSEQVLLLYLEGKQGTLQEHLDDPPPGFKDSEELTRALEGMRSDLDSVPVEEFEKTPFLDAHEDLEEKLGG